MKKKNMINFKVGDKVKVIHNCSWKGQIGEIRQIFLKTNYICGNSVDEVMSLFCGLRSKSNVAILLRNVGQEDSYWTPEWSVEDLELI